MVQLLANFWNWSEIITKHINNWISCLCLFLVVILPSIHSVNGDSPGKIRLNRPCSDLLPGQFLCLPLKINPTTQQLEGCQAVQNAPPMAKIKCRAAENITCTGLEANNTFWKEVPCKLTNGYSFEISLVLSVLLGMFGVDRFYLGYIGIGILKLCTLGGFFVFQLVDIVLIASGKLGPADGSQFVVPYYGPGLEHLNRTARTFLRPPQDL